MVGVIIEWIGRYRGIAVGPTELGECVAAFYVENESLGDLFFDGMVVCDIEVHSASVGAQICLESGKRIATHCKHTDDCLLDVCGDDTVKAEGASGPDSSQ